MSKASELALARREALSRLHHAIGIFREYRSEMGMQTAHVFIIIAQYPGLLQHELEALAGLGQSAVSRNLRQLVSTDPQENGLGLVVKQFDIDNPKSYALRLSKTGKELAERLIGALQGHEKTTGTVATRRRGKP